MVEKSIPMFAIDPVHDNKFQRGWQGTGAPKSRWCSSVSRVAISTVRRWLRLLPGSPSCAIHPTSAPSREELPRTRALKRTCSIAPLRTKVGNGHRDCSALRCNGRFFRARLGTEFRDDESFASQGGVLSRKLPFVEHSQQSSNRRLYLAEIFLRYSSIQRVISPR